MKKLLMIFISGFVVMACIGVTKINALSEEDVKNGIFNKDNYIEYVNDIFNPNEVEKNIALGKQKEIEFDAKVLTRAAKGTYPSRKGVILYTPDKLWGLPIGHAAMVYDKDYVYEALPDKGVYRGKNNWSSKKTQVYGLGVKGTSVAQDAKAGEYCKRQEKKPYNWAMASIHKRDSFYCSHLIYAAYLDTCKVDLNTPKFDGGYAADGRIYKSIHPSELLSGPNTTLLYRKK